MVSFEVFYIFVVIQFSVLRITTSSIIALSLAQGVFLFFLKQIREKLNNDFQINFWNFCIDSEETSYIFEFFLQKYAVSKNKSTHLEFRKWRYCWLKINYFFSEFRWRPWKLHGEYILTGFPLFYSNYADRCRMVVPVPKTCCNRYFEKYWSSYAHFNIFV